MTSESSTCHNRLEETLPTGDFFFHQPLLEAHVVLFECHVGSMDTATTPTGELGEPAIPRYTEMTQKGNENTSSYRP